MVGTSKKSPPFGNSVPALLQIGFFQVFDRPDLLFVPGQAGTGQKTSCPTFPAQAGTAPPFLVEF